MEPRTLTLPIVITLVRATKPKLTLFVLSCLLAAGQLPAQVSISPGNSYTESFDGLGSASAISVPAPRISLMNRACLSILFAGAMAAPAAQPGLIVKAALKPSDPWKDSPTQTLDDLPEAVVARTDSGLSQYGGMRARKAKATGFFYPARIEGRWWLVDPEGCLFLHKGVDSVRMLDTSASRDAWKQRSGSETNWPSHTIALLREHSFNGLAAC